MVKKMTTVYLRLKVHSGFTEEDRMDLLLGFLEGYGVLPPKRWRDKNWNELGITYSAWTQLGSEVNEWNEEENTLSPNKTIPNESYDLLVNGICPCGSNSHEGCSVTGCPLYCQQEFKNEKK